MTSPGGDTSDSEAPARANDLPAAASPEDAAPAEDSASVADDEALGARDDRPPIDKKHLARITGPIIALVIANNLGNFFFATLSTENPLLLIALSPPNRNLILASGQVPLWAYFLVGFLRLIAPDPFFYALGESYGDRAISWMEHRTATVGRMMRQLEDLFARYGHALVVIMPNNPICLIAGAARMPKKVFWTLNVVGTIGRLLVMLLIGKAFQDLIDAILAFISEYRIYVFAVTAGLTVLSLAFEFRSGTSEIQQLMELDEELEHAPEAVDGEPS